MCDEDPDGNTHSLTAKDIVEIRTDWGMGVPLSTLAEQRDITEKSLRQQLGLTTSRAIPEPPAGKRGLIGPAEVAQMTDRKQQLRALREMIADREGGTMGDESKPDKWKLIRGTNLKTEDRHVLLTLFLYQGDNGAAFCKQETLAQEIGIDPRSVRRSLKRLNAAGIVRSEWKILNSVPMRTYAIDFQTLKTVQRCDGRTPASYPETSDGRTPASASVGHQRPDHQDTSVLQEDPLNIQRRSRGARAPKTRFQKPTAEQVREYATSQGCSIFDAGKFCDHYESNGWRIGGKGAMKDWRATVRNWIRSGGTQGNGRTSGNTNAEQAWQTLKDVLRKIDKSKQYKDLLRQQLKPEVYQAADALGFKALFSIDQFNESKLFAAFSTAMAGVKND